MHYSIVEALKIVKWPVFPRLLLLKLSSALICVSVFPAVRVQSQSGKDSSGLRRILCTHSKTRRSSEASTGQSDPSLRSDSVMMIHRSPPQTSAAPRVCVSLEHTSCTSAEMQWSAKRTVIGQTAGLSSWLQMWDGQYVDWIFGHITHSQSENMIFLLLILCDETSGHNATVASHPSDPKRVTWMIMRGNLSSVTHHRTSAGDWLVSSTSGRQSITIFSWRGN